MELLMNKGIKTTIYFIFMFFMSCNKTDEIIIISQTTQELINEFTADWNKAHNHYKGKYIKVSGVRLYAVRESIGLGEYPVDDDRIKDYLRDNIIINCVFNNMVFPYDLEVNENIVVLGKYQGFTNRPMYNLIELKDCILVLGDAGATDHANYFGLKGE
jgi:hypothetical protein